MIPSRSAARPKSAPSPRGSAAATNKRRWVSAGRASSRFTKLSSILPDNDSAPGNPNPPAKLRGRKPPRQLQQRQRVSPRLGQQLIGDPLVQPSRDHRHQQRPRIDTSKTPRQPAPADPSTGRSAHAQRTTSPPTPPATVAPRTPHTARMPGPTTARHRPRTQAGARPPPPKGGSTPRARRESDPAPGRRAARTWSEERRAAATGKALEAIEYGRAQLMKRSERKLHLRLNPDRTQNSQIRRRADRIVEKRGFPNPGLALHHQRPAPSSPRPIEQPIEHRALVSPTAQHQPPRS